MEEGEIPPPSPPPTAPLPPSLPPIPLLDTVDHNQLLALLRQPADANQAAWIEIIEDPSGVSGAGTSDVGSAENSTNQESRNKEDEVAPLQDNQPDSSSDTTASNAGSCKQKPEMQIVSTTKEKDETPLAKKQDGKPKERGSSRQGREDGSAKGAGVENKEGEAGEEDGRKVSKKDKKERGRKRFMWQEEEELQDPVQEAKRRRAIRARHNRERTMAREEKLQALLKQAEAEVVRVSQERDQYKEMCATLQKKLQRREKRQSKSKNIATTARTSTT